MREYTCRDCGALPGERHHEKCGLAPGKMCVGDGLGPNGTDHEVVRLRYSGGWMADLVVNGKKGGTEAAPESVGAINTPEAAMEWAKNRWPQAADIDFDEFNS